MHRARIIEPGTYMGPTQIPAGDVTILIPAGVICVIHEPLDLDAREADPFRKRGDLATFTLVDTPFAIRVGACIALDSDDVFSAAFGFAYTPDDAQMFGHGWIPSHGTLRAYLEYARDQMMWQAALRLAYTPGTPISEILAATASPWGRYALRHAPGIPDEVRTMAALDPIAP